MNTPLVSILLPVYNGSKFLTECLDSILAQDFANLEILIADDDSSDGSAAVLENYAAYSDNGQPPQSAVNQAISGTYPNFGFIVQGEVRTV